MGHKTILTMLFVVLLSLTAGAQTARRGILLTIYPNPAQTYVYVTSNIQLNVNMLHLTNLLLEDVDLKKRATLEEKNTIHIDLSDLDRGLYIISMTDPISGEKESRKLVLK